MVRKSRPITFLIVLAIFFFVSLLTRGVASYLYGYFILNSQGSFLLDVHYPYALSSSICGSLSAVLLAYNRLSWFVVSWLVAVTVVSIHLLMIELSRNANVSVFYFLALVSPWIIAISSSSYLSSFVVSAQINSPHSSGDKLKNE